MNERAERLSEAVLCVKRKSNIRFQKDIAEKMEADESTFSLALKGSEKYLTNTFLKRFTDTFSYISYEWLADGKGEMLTSDIKPNETITLQREVWDVIKNQAASLNARDEQVSEMIALLKEQIDQKRAANTENQSVAVK